MEDKYKGFKVTILDYQEPDRSKLGDWDKVGSKDKYECPECIYLGKICPKCSDK